MSDHPSPAELYKFWEGSLATEERQAVVSHLIRGCPSCQTEMRRQTGITQVAAERTPEPTPGEHNAYDAALDAAFSRVKNWGEDAVQVTHDRRKVLALLEAGDPRTLESIPAQLHGAPLVEALLDKSWNLRHESPERMLHFAYLAVVAAKELDAELLGADRVGACRSRAHAALGNALRIVGHFEEAQRQINQAYEIYLQGPACASEEARLLDLQASLHSSHRRFDQACEILKTVYGTYRRIGEDHLAGRALVSQAVYAGYAGHPREALQLLEMGLSLVDGERDPDLVLMARHNQAYLLADLGRYREARTLLFEIRLLHGGNPKKVNTLKLRWLEGRINRGLGHLDRAERDFLEAREGCIAAGLPFQAALCGFEVGLVRMDLGRRQEARRDVLEAASVFLELNIGREALMTVAFVRHAFEQELEARALLERTIELLGRSDHGPRLLLKVHET